MKNKVLAYIEDNSMISKGDRVLVALSGGPDSVCLLALLNELKDILNIEIFAAHLNHCLRGKEADKDQDYAKGLCEEVGIPFFEKKEDINILGKKLGMSSEMAGRKARYDFFEEIKQKNHIDKIALAHNANDQAETLLMRIMRGTGMDGIEGIKPIRDKIYIRPILCATRKEIEEYCSEKNLKPRIDKTNLEPIYSRNKVRLELIPYIEENFNQDIVSTLNRFSSIATLDNSYLEEMAEKKYGKYVSVKNHNIIIDKQCFEEHEAIIIRIIRKSFYEISGSLNNFQYNHIWDIINLQKKYGGKTIDLPMDIMAENIYGSIVMKHKNQQNLEDKSVLNIDLEENKINNFKKGLFVGRIFNYNVFIKLIENNENINLKGSKYVKFFQFIPGKSITIRNKNQGDRFQPYGMNGSKKLKDFFMDLKIPKEEREITPIVLFDDAIVWVVGYRTSNSFKIDNKMRDVLEIRFEREENTYA